MGHALILFSMISCLLASFSSFIVCDISGRACRILLRFLMPFESHYIRELHFDISIPVTAQYDTDAFIIASRFAHFIIAALTFI